MKPNLYTWEIQRPNDTGQWTDHNPGDPCGTETSPLDPEPFARMLADRERLPAGEWRIAVWDTPAADRPPAAIHNPTQEN